MIDMQSGELDVEALPENLLELATDAVAVVAGRDEHEG